MTVVEAQAVEKRAKASAEANLINFVADAKAHKTAMMPEPMHAQTLATRNTR